LWFPYTTLMLTTTTMLFILRHHTGRYCGRVWKNKLTTDPIQRSGGEPVPLATPQSLQVSSINADRAIAVMIQPTFR